MCDAVNFKNNNELIGLDMILLDEEGTAIHAFIRKNQVERYRKLISEGEVYTVTNFKVVEATGNYRPVHNKFKIFFLLTTSIAPYNRGSKIPMHYFEFVEHDEITKCYYDKTYLTDVIGRLHRLGPVKEGAVPSGVAPVRPIEIELKEGKIVTTNIWDSSAMQIENEFDSTSSLSDIVIVTSTTAKSFLGECTLSTTAASKIFFNLAIGEVSKLHIRFAGSDPCIKSTQSERSFSMSDQELALQNRKTIADLLQMQWQQNEQGLRLTCLAKVHKIENKFGWYYISCELCRKKVKPSEESLWCERCNRAPTLPTPRYKLQLQVTDSSGSTTFVVFDKQAEKMINKTAKELASMVNETDEVTKVPPILQNLCENMYIFQIQLTEYNTKDGLENFTVTKVWNPMITGDGEAKKIVGPPDEQPIQPSLHNVQPNKHQAQEMKDLTGQKTIAEHMDLLQGSEIKTNTKKSIVSDNVMDNPSPQKDGKGKQKFSSKTTNSTTGATTT